MTRSADPSGPRHGSAAALGLEDEVLGMLYASLAQVASGHPLWLDAFAAFAEERMEIFLPADRSKLLADVFLRRTAARRPTVGPTDKAHQCYLTGNLLEAAARLAEREHAQVSERIRELHWTLPWIDQAESFVRGRAGAGVLQFSAMPCASSHVPVRGHVTGSMSALHFGPHWFVRHDWEAGADVRFCGARWPAGHTLWLKPADTVELAGQKFDTASLNFLSAHQLPEMRQRYLHGAARGAVINQTPSNALARVEFHHGCVVDCTEARTWRINGESAKGPAPVLPNDRVEIAGMALSALRLMRVMNIGATHPPPWQVLLKNVSLRFKDGSSGLDDLTLALQSGDLVAMMGPSGCGKSTLLSLLSGELRAQHGALDISVCAGRAPVFALVPQDDVLFPELTVHENLASAAALRGASSADERHTRVRDALAAVSLEGKDALRVGSVVDKVLSGGERKRLNIAMELTGTPDAVLLDEPTSGLSSADAGSVMNVLRTHADAGMLVMAVIHQPSREMFEMFDKVIVLDVGGRLAYFGTPAGAQRYFDVHVPGISRRQWGPDRILETLIGRRTTLDGRSQRRVFDPAFWQLRYKASRREYEPPLLTVEEDNTSDSRNEEPAPRATLAATAQTIFWRELLRRAREWRGSVASCSIAVALSCVIGQVCRVHAPGAEYAFARNPNVPAFCFLAVILVQFLALSASVQELVKDRAHRLRERLLQVPAWCWLLAKIPGLLMLIAVQSGLVVLCAGALVGSTYARAGLWLSLTLVGWCCIAMGLLVSALPRMTERVALAAVPLLLVPQMILCGAKPFEFRDLGHLHWPFRVPALKQDESPKPPWIASWMPSRWAYQAAVCGLRDDPYIAPVKDLRPLLMTYNNARRMSDEWRRDPAAFLSALAGRTGQTVTETELREQLTLLIRTGTRSADEMTEAFGDLLPQAHQVRADLETARNEIFLDYARGQFPAPRSDPLEIVNHSRWVLLWQGVMLICVAAAIMRISPRAIIDFLAKLRWSL